MGATRPKFSREFKLRARTTAEVNRRATPLIRPDFARSDWRWVGGGAFLSSTAAWRCPAFGWENRHTWAESERQAARTGSRREKPALSLPSNDANRCFHRCLGARGRRAVRCRSLSPRPSDRAAHPLATRAPTWNPINAQPLPSEGP